MFNLNEKQRFSLRKLSVGLASVLIGISFASATGNSAKADTVSVQTSVAETSKNNKVDANADASKEVAKSTNSVDSNKLSPSQTVLNKQVTSNDALKGTDAKQEQVVESDQNSVAEQNNLLDDLGKQKTSAQSGDQAEAKNQENRLVDQINYKLTNNTSTDNKKDLGQKLTAPDETKQAPTTKSDAEKSTVSSSSTQQVSNQSNNHAEDNSQTQLNITKNSQQLDQKELATNLTQDNSTQNNDWADPAKQGFHKTNVGWTKHTIGDGTFDAIAKSVGSWTIDNVTSQKTITSNYSYFLPVQHLKDVVISKDDLKTKKNILIGTAIRLRDPASENGYATKFNWIWTSPNYVYASDGSLLGTLYFADNDNNDHTKNDEIDYIFQVHTDKSVLDRITSDLKFSYTDQNQLVINDDSGTNRLPTGKTIHEKYILGNSNSVDVTTNNPAFKPNDYKETDWQQYKLNTSPRYSQVNFGYWTSDSSKNDPTNYTYHQVIKVQGNPENNHFDLSNMSIYTRRYINMSQDANSSHIFSTNGSNNQWSDKYYYNRTKLQDNLSALDVYNQTTKNNRLTYSVQKDGSVLIGINVDTTDPEWKLSDNDIKSAFSFNKYYQSLSAKDQQTMMNETLKKYHNHSNFAFENDISVQGINWDHSKSIVETVTDVTPNKPAWQNSNPIVVSYAVGSSTNIDLAQFRTYNVQYKDELTGKIVNNDIISTQTGSNVDYSINIPKGFLLVPNQTIIVDGNSVTLDNANKFQFAVPKNEPVTPTPIIINLTHKHSNITDPSQLQTTGKRTITINLPHQNKTMIIIQTVGYKRTGDLDEATNTPTYTDWVFDADTSNVTVDGQLSTQYQAYVLKDGVVNYAPITLPHINGYKAKLIQNKANPAMFMVSFVALPQQNNQSNNVQSSQKTIQDSQKPVEPVQTAPADQQEEKEVAQILDHIAHELMNDDADSFEPAQTDSAPLETADVTQKVKPEPTKPAPIETQIPVETHDSLSNYTLTTNDPIPDTRVFNNIESNELTWQIGNKNLNNNSINVPYYVTNTIYKLRLPRFSNYELHLVKRGTTQDSVSFVYVNKQTQLNYVFNLKIQDNKYYLTVVKIDRVNRKILPIKTYNVISYQDLLDIFDKYFK